MRVGVIGAGVSGLTAARELARAGAQVTVFEQDDRIGGRCMTVSLEGYTFDAGATSIVPRGREVEHVIERQLDTSDLVEIGTPVYTHDGRRIFLGSGMAAVRRFCYRQGIQRFAELLAEGLDVKTGRRVDAFEAPLDGGFVVQGAAYDALVLACTTTESQRILETVGDPRRANNTRYRACLSVLMGFETTLEAPYHAVVAEESVHPLHWLSIENLKVTGRAPHGCTALVVQMGPKYSKWKFDADEATIVADALVDVERVLGPGFESPVVQHIVRWKESQPDSVSGFEPLNPPGTRLVMTGDGLEGGRIEHAYDAGIKAAKLLAEL